MAAKVNLNKLKDEIDNRKRNKNTVSSALGEQVGTDVAPRDVFLHGLVESLNTGKETHSSSLVKTVDNRVSEKKGENTKLPINPAAPPQNVPTVSTINEGGMSPERDSQLYNDIDKRRGQTLAESMQSFTGNQNAVVPPTVNYNGQQMLTSAPVGTGVPAGINEGALDESVRKIVNNHLIENFGPVLEEAIKNTVIEMYAVERIKEVLNENRDLIRTVVIDTIKEIQAKTKAKQKA